MLAIEMLQMFDMLYFKLLCMPQINYFEDDIF